jgi:choline dehydrogenase-like flavoprotein
MIADFESIRDKVFDYVIVGSGPAGILLAEKLKASGSVLIVERGGIDDPADVGDESYELDVTGLPYDKFGSRLATFGGTSNHWGGQSHPMSRSSFETALAGHSWPIDYFEYLMHLPDALEFLRLKEFADPDAPMPASNAYRLAENLHLDEFQVSSPILRIGDEETVGKYVEDQAIQLLPGTRITQIQLSESTEKVASLTGLKNGKFQQVNGRNFILASGGIENARLMLWSARQYAAGNPLQGGPNKLTGKYFMEHPHISPLDIFFQMEVDLRKTNWHDLGNKKVAHMWRPSQSFIQQHQLSRFGALIYNQTYFDFDPDLLNSVDDKYIYDRERYVRAQVTLMFEQSPYESSQVRLSRKRDANDFPIAELDWRISPEDIAMMQKTALLFGGILSQFGNARVRFRDEFKTAGWEGARIGYGNHHMGTTRMAHRHEDGVVDHNCKVFGLDNLYIAGSSIFVRADYVNPTLNLAVFAARLGNHLVAMNPASAKTLRFGDFGDDNPSLVSGWSAPEEKGVWSDSKYARLKLPRAQSIKQIQFIGHAFKRARVVVKLDGKQIFQGPVAKLVKTKIPVESDSKSQMIEFEFTKITSPFDHGESADKRELGLFIERIIMD